MVPLVFQKPALDVKELGDGALELAHPDPWVWDGRLLPAILRDHGKAIPHAPALAEEAGDGLRQLTYGEIVAMMDQTVGGMWRDGLRPGQLMVIAAANSIDHAIITWAAMALGVIVVPVSVAAAAQGAPALTGLLAGLNPAWVLTDSQAVMAALRSSLPQAHFEALKVVATRWTLPGPIPEGALAAQSALTAETPAKLLLTSGSTGSPKPVLYTHGMLAQVPQINAAMLPEVAGDQVICDWLPWSHTYGSTINLHGALVNGSLFVIDQGLPMPGAFDRTANLLAVVRPTFYAGVPASFMLLAERLDRDPIFAAAFFDRLIGVGFGGAALPPGLIAQLQKAAQRAAGRGLTVGGGYGMTETAGIATSVYWENSRGDLIGLPPRGVRLRLYPLGDGRSEVRVKGPNVTPGYWQLPDLTAQMFDEAGFYRTGDAVLFADPQDPTAGLIFGGRLAEDFKLASGTFVRVGALRLALIEALSPVVKEAIIVGENQSEAGALLVVDPVILAREAAAEGCSEQEWLAQRLGAARIGQGGSMAIKRALITGLPPDRSAGEITDKGSLNQALCRRRRTVEVAQLYEGDGPGIIFPRLPAHSDR